MVWPEPIAPVMVPTSSIARVITGAAGTVVSTTSVKPGEAGLMLPAASVAVAVGVAAVCQRAGSKAPYAVGISHGGAHRLTILIDGNGRVGCRGAVQRWRGVVCALSRGDRAQHGTGIVGGRGKDRCFGHRRIHRQVERWRGDPGIACGIGGVKGNGMRPFTQRGGRREGPVTPALTTAVPISTSSTITCTVAPTSPVPLKVDGCRWWNRCWR